MWQRLGLCVGFLVVVVAVLLLSAGTVRPSAPPHHYEVVDRATLNRRLLVIAPHPDDEIVGAGPWLVAAGGRRLVVVLTAGDSFTAAARLARPTSSRPDAFYHLGQERSREVRAALRRGSPGTGLLFLGYPDKSLSALLSSHQTTALRSRATGCQRVSYQGTPHAYEPQTGENLLRDLDSILKKFRPEVVLFPSAYDQHADHHAAAALVELALSAYPRVRAYQYLVHWPTWPAPAGYWPHLPLLPPPGLEGSGFRWSQVALDATMRRRLLAALTQHRTQVRLLRPYLVAFVRRNGLYARVAPLRLGTTITEPREGNGKMVGLLAAGRLTWRRTGAQELELSLPGAAQSRAFRGHLEVVARTYDQHLTFLESSFPFHADVVRPRLPAIVRRANAVARIVIEEQGQRVFTTGWRLIPRETRVQNSLRPSSDRTNVTSSA
jgi:LmbE family N-acetylglucosaminyl deacetylase